MTMSPTSNPHSLSFTACYQGEDESVDEWIDRKLELFHSRGIRSLQLVHELDSRFGGVAIHEPVRQLHSCREHSNYYFEQLLLTANTLLSVVEYTANLHSPWKLLSNSFSDLVHNHVNQDNEMFLDEDQDMTEFSKPSTLIDIEGNHLYGPQPERNITDSSSAPSVGDLVWKTLQNCPSRLWDLVVKLNNILSKTNRFAQTEPRANIKPRQSNLGGRKNSKGLTQLGLLTVKKAIEKVQTTH